jgi:hypothetical protein
VYAQWGQKRQQITFHARGRRRKKKWNEPAWHPKLIVPILNLPPVLFILIQPVHFGKDFLFVGCWVNARNHLLSRPFLTAAQKSESNCRDDVHVAV